MPEHNFSTNAQDARTRESDLVAGRARVEGRSSGVEGREGVADAVDARAESSRARVHHTDRIFNKSFADESQEERLVAAHCSKARCRRELRPSMRRRSRPAIGSIESRAAQLSGTPTEHDVHEVAPVELENLRLAWHA